MYIKEPYGFPQPQPPSFTPTSRMNFLRNSRTRCALLCAASLCGLLIIGVGLSVLIAYFARYRNNVSSLLSYPDFICGQRPCGCPNLNRQKSFFSRIVGGKEPVPFSYPWLVAITDRYTIEPFCAGFVISPNEVLTAAHCLAYRRPDQLQILAKLHDLRQFSGYRYDIEKFFVHHEYQFNDSMHLNDIALIKIKYYFPNDIQPCCLPSVESSIFPSPKTPAVASGWGKLGTKSNNRNSPILQHVVMPIVDEKSTKCRQSIIDPKRQLCAGYDKLPIDTCSGDSGSPLLTVEYNNRKQGHFVAAGIVSYGNRECDASISSGVYTRVGFYLPWIRSIRANL